MKRLLIAVLLTGCGGPPFSAAQIDLLENVDGGTELDSGVKVVSEAGVDSGVLSYEAGEGDSCSNIGQGNGKVTSSCQTREGGNDQDSGAIEVDSGAIEVDSGNGYDGGDCIMGQSCFCQLGSCGSDVSCEISCPTNFQNPAQEVYCCDFNFHKCFLQNGSGNTCLQ